MSPPQVVIDKEVKKLFGIIKLCVIVENRSPDITGYDSQYKTQINVYVLNKCFGSFIFRSKELPFLMIDGIEL